MIWKPSDNQYSGSQHHVHDYKGNTHVSFEVQGHVDIFFRYPGCFDGRVFRQKPEENQQCYIEIVTKLRESVRRKQQELWRNRWILNQDNAKAHKALSIKQCLTNKNITLLGHPSNLPDLAPCEFYLFPRIKSALKRTIFLWVENLKTKMSEIINSRTQHEPRNYFEHWQHCMQLCVNSEGNYIEGDRSWFLEFTN
jgi:hypothetical protein